MLMLSKTSLIQTFQFLRYRVPLVLVEKLEHYIEICSFHLTMYHHATLICLLFPGHQYQGGKSLRNRTLIYRSLIVQIPKLYRLRLRQLEQIKTIQMIVTVLVILMNMILLWFRMNFSPVKTSVTAPRKQMATAIQRILYLPIIYRISQFHRLCREGLQDLENHPIISVNGCRNWFYAAICFMPRTVFFNAE